MNKNNIFAIFIAVCFALSFIIGFVMGRYEHKLKEIVNKKNPTQIELKILNLEHRIRYIERILIKKGGSK